MLVPERAIMLKYHQKQRREFSPERDAKAWHTAYSAVASPLNLQQAHKDLSHLREGVAARLRNKRERPHATSQQQKKSVIHSDSDITWQDSGHKGCLQCNVSPCFTVLPHAHRLHSILTTMLFTLFWFRCVCLLHCPPSPSAPAYPHRHQNQM